MSSLITLAQEAAINIHRAGSYIVAASALSYLPGRFIAPLNLSGEYCAKFTAIFSAAAIAFFTTSIKGLSLNKEAIPFMATLVGGATYLTCHLSGFEKTWTTLAKAGTVVTLATSGSLMLFIETNKNSTTTDKASAMLKNGCLNIQRIALASASAWAFNKIVPLSFKSEHTAPLAMLASTIYYLAQPFFKAADQADQSDDLINQGNKAISWLFLTKVAANYLNISTPWKQSSVALAAALIPEALVLLKGE